MKKINVRSSISMLFGIFLAIILVSKKQLQSPAKNTLELFQSKMLATSEYIRFFEASLLEYEHGEINKEDVTKRFLTLRNKYKSCELFLAYFEPEVVNGYLNGAPLPRLASQATAIEIVDPVGLQVMDEILFEDTIDVEALHELTNSLKLEFIRVKQYRSNLNLQDRQIFEACRSECIRIFTLGVTGFDTPGSQNAIPEAKTALESVQEVMLFYSEVLKAKGFPQYQELYETLTQGVTYLDQNDGFDEFDRLTLLTKYINPLYELIYEAHVFLNIETINETGDYLKAVNYNATNLFDENFLNKTYYSYLNQSEKDSAKILLGKTLFFDPVLSANNERSCASCHDPQKAFTDGNAKSIAFNMKGTVKRNSPTCINAVYADKYFWDLRSDQLKSQIEHVILSNAEFNTSYAEIVHKLNQSSEYKTLFHDAFGNHISQDNISNALNHYVSSLVALNSPFDQYVRGESKELSEQAKHGFNLFMGKAACGTCHFAPIFNGTVPVAYEESESEVLGVPASKDTLFAMIDSDLGRMVNNRPKEAAPFHAFAFKTVTVRNSELTAPYMHNGVFDSLQEVIDFYDRGGGIGLGIDLENQTLSSTPLHLSQSEKLALEAFLISLTDTVGTTSLPKELPKFDDVSLNKRNLGGVY